MAKKRTRGSDSREAWLLKQGALNAADLVKRATSWEIEFRDKLEKLGIPYSFQQPIVCRKNHLYIVDFYLPDYKLIFELDGAHHLVPWKVKEDTKRTRHLEERGLKVKRIMNRDVKDFTLSVLAEYLKSQLKHAPKG